MCLLLIQLFFITGKAQYWYHICESAGEGLSPVTVRGEAWKHAYGDQGIKRKHRKNLRVMSEGFKVKSLGEKKERERETGKWRKGKSQQIMDRKKNGAVAWVQPCPFPWEIYIYIPQLLILKDPQFFFSNVELPIKYTLSLILNYFSDDLLGQGKKV